MHNLLTLSAEGRNQRGFFTLEILISAALSTIVLMGIMSSYLLIKEQYLKQCLLADQQENIRTLYLFLKKLIDESTDINTYSANDSSSSLKISSDVLEIKSKDHLYKIYIRETLRNKLKSLYLKKDDLNAQEFIENASKFTVNISNNTKKTLQVKIKFNTGEVSMFFECKENAI